ncbi:MAG: ABC transporter substrate-binding protein [Bacillota bacterium]|nr:ABC transporter substrate-binding protein [Bacillota bacterium]
MVLPLAACSQGSSDPASGELEPIKIGAVLSQTGTVAHAGINAQRACEILLEEVNAAGGIKGRKVELIVENSNTEPERAVTAALKLTNENKVLAIIGPDNTSTAIAVRDQVAEVDEIVSISVTGSSPKLTEGNPRWFFRGATPANYQMSALTKYMVDELKFTKFAVLADATLTDQADALVADLEKYNLKPLAIETHKSGDTNFNGQLIKIKPYNPEAIIFIGYVTECASAIKQARDMGIDAQFAGSIGIVYQELCDIGGDIVEGTLGTIGFTVANPDPRVQEFAKKFKEKYGEEPDHAAGQAYDQLSLVLDAIRNEDLSFDPKDIKSDRTLIRDYLENKTYGYNGLTAMINYTKEEHTAYKMVNVMQIKGGTWTILVPSSEL